MVTTISANTSTTGALERPPGPYFIARGITVAAALAVDGETYLGIVAAGGRLAFAFADRDGTLRAKAKAVWRRAAPPVQPRDLMRAYFDLRADLARARGAHHDG